MRVLILSCNTGGGHNSCAKAIQKCFEQNGDICDIADSLSFVSKNFTKMMSEGHSLMYRKFPKVFSVGYEVAEKRPGAFEKESALSVIFEKGAKELSNLIKSGRYDTVISVHVFPGIMLKKAFSDGEFSDVKTAFVATDYTCSPGVCAFDYDYYFIPDETVTKEFVSKGIPFEKIFPVGIPVNERFYENIPKNRAKLSFSVSPAHRHLVIMCGSMGCGPVEEITDILSKTAESDVEISVVCGTNQKLFNNLYEKYRTTENIHIMSYVSDVSLLLDSADLYLTKPGGLSSTEAFSKGVPMVFIDAVSGCEKHNLEFFLEAGGGETADSCKELAEKCLFLLGSPERLSLLSANLLRRRKKHAAAEIFKTLGGEENCFCPKEIIGDFALKN